MGIISLFTILKMRLNPKEINAIKEVAKMVFGEDSTIRLFGSRTDDTKKGGDIDLLVQCNNIISREVQYQLKIKFLVELKKIIGDQKIDILIDQGQQSEHVFRAVKKTSILL